MKPLANTFQRLPGSWRLFCQINGVELVEAVGSQVTQILNKQLNADTALLFQISVVALGELFINKNRTRCRLVAASLRPGRLSKMWKYKCG